MNDQSNVRPHISKLNQQEDHAMQNNGTEARRKDIARMSANNAVLIQCGFRGRTFMTETDQRIANGIEALLLQVAPVSTENPSISHGTPQVVGNSPASETLTAIERALAEQQSPAQQVDETQTSNGEGSAG